MLHLHTRDPPLIHRDLKSCNLLVDDSWRIKAGGIWILLLPPPPPPLLQLVVQEKGSVADCTYTEGGWRMQKAPPPPPRLL